MTAAHVVGGWALFNAVLVGVLVLYGEDLLFVAMYAGPALASLLVALIVWLRKPRTSAGRRAHRLSATSLSAALAGVAVLFAGLAFVYGYWLFVATGAMGLMALARARRERLPEGTVPVPTRVPTLHAMLDRNVPADDRLTKGVKAVVTVVLASKALPGARRGRKGPRS